MHTSVLLANADCLLLPVSGFVKDLWHTFMMTCADGYLSQDKLLMETRAKPHSDGTVQHFATSVTKNVSFSSHPIMTAFSDPERQFAL